MAVAQEEVQSNRALPSNGHPIVAGLLQQGCGVGEPGMKVTKPKKHFRPKVKYYRHDRERLTAEKRAPTEERGDFERDRSRIIHSAAFRRLQGKTQVFTVGEGDFFRTRLTHSLEVAQIGKGLALRLGADTDLVEAICLVHDIGHPPFGHAGEDELKKLMACYGGFEANAQNIRILTKLEKKSSYEGLNLTRAVIDGQLKYRKAYPEDRCKFIYEDDVELMDWAGEEACAVVGASNRQQRPFECEIMDWADDIAYAVHDLEDSIHSGHIDAASFHDKFVIDEVVEVVAKEFKDCSVDAPSVCNAFIYNYLPTQNPDFGRLTHTINHRDRKANRKTLTSALINRYIVSTSRKKRSDVSEGPVSWRYCYSMHVPIEYRVEVFLLKELVMRLVIRSPQVRTLEEKSRHIVRNLFEKLIQAKDVEHLLPNDWKEHLPSKYTERDKARVVSDYISGMTDQYAEKTYARLFLPGQGSIYEVM